MLVAQCVAGHGSEHVLDSISDHDGLAHASFSLSFTHAWRYTLICSIRGNQFDLKAQVIDWLAQCSAVKVNDQSSTLIYLQPMRELIKHGVNTPGKSATKLAVIFSIVFTTDLSLTSHKRIPWM